MAALERRGTVLVTRPEPGGSQFAAELSRRGIQATQLPTIRVVPNEDLTALDSVLQRTETFDWIVFASPRSVEMVVERCRVRFLSVEPLKRANLLAGPSTSALLRQEGLNPTELTPRFSARSVVERLGALRRPGMRVFLPSAEDGRDELQIGLEAMGVLVDRVSLYRTEVEPKFGEDIRRLLVVDSNAVVTLASPSAARGLLAVLGLAEEADAPGLVNRHLVVTLGGTTAEECRTVGIRVTAVAKETSNRGFADAVERLTVRTEVRG